MLTLDTTIGGVLPHDGQATGVRAKTIQMARPRPLAFGRKYLIFQSSSGMFCTVAVEEVLVSWLLVLTDLLDLASNASRRRVCGVALGVASRFQGRLVSVKSPPAPPGGAPKQPRSLAGS